MYSYVSHSLCVVESDDEKDICFMCDKNVVNTKFEPCGHSVMCEEDAYRAKRCSVCKVRFAFRIVLFVLLICTVVYKVKY